MKPLVPFALPDIGEEEIAEAIDTLRSGWLTAGKKTRQFEREFSQFIAPDLEAIAVNSATAGLHLVLEAIGIGPGDEVITTPYTFTATAEIVRHLGADLVFVDIDPATLNLDPKQIEAAITPRTKAIVPVHIGGLACEMAAIIDIARAYGLRIVEDAAHAIPTTYRGQAIGSLATDATVFSFYPTKPIATGEGGMIVTRDRAIAERCRVMRVHGIDRDAYERQGGVRPSWYYEVVAPGFRYNMTDLTASLGIHQLRKCRQHYQRRADIARCYDRELAALPLVLPPHPPAGDLHSWHLYVVRLSATDSHRRDGLIDDLARRGIECSVHYIPLHLHPYWRDTYRLKPDDFPQSLAAYQSAISLPIYSKMSDADRTHVIEALHQTLSFRSRAS